MMSTITLCLLLAAGMAQAQPAAAPPATPAAVYEPVRLQAGVWDADISFFDPASGERTGGAKGVQTNVLLANGHWVTNDLQVHGPEGAKGQPTFQGHGVWGWDPVARQYVDTWVDTNDGAVRTDYGFWNEQTRTLYWTALQPDGNGHSVNYRMTEAYEGNDKRTLTFYQVALQSGRLVKLAEMRFTRRPG
ncbi:DUF1579 family protein [Ideonella sp. BN130291]|nr:DUF1579 family protein [Ideonella sp. BN130291]